MTNPATPIGHSQPVLPAPVELFMTVTGVKQGAIRGHAGANESDRIPVIAVGHEMGQSREGGTASGGGKTKKPLVITVPMGFSFPALYDAASAAETLRFVTISATEVGKSAPDWFLTATGATIIQAVIDGQTENGKDCSSLRMTLTYQDIVWRQGDEPALPRAANA